jgi:hypothetical protein
MDLSDLGGPRYPVPPLSHVRSLRSSWRGYRPAAGYRPSLAPGTPLPHQIAQVWMEVSK